MKAAEGAGNFGKDGEDVRPRLLEAIRERCRREAAHDLEEFLSDSLRR
jgi:hypothetical protein